MKKQEYMNYDKWMNYEENTFGNEDICVVRVHNS